MCWLLNEMRTRAQDTQMPLGFENALQAAVFFVCVCSNTDKVIKNLTGQCKKTPVRRALLALTCSLAGARALTHIPLHLQYYSYPRRCSSWPATSRQPLSLCHGKATATLATPRAALLSRAQSAQHGHAISHTRAHLLKAVRGITAPQALPRTCRCKALGAEELRDKLQKLRSLKQEASELLPPTSTAQTPALQPASSRSPILGTPRTEALRQRPICKGGSVTPSPSIGTRPQGSTPQSAASRQQSELLQRLRQLKVEAQTVLGQTG